MGHQPAVWAPQARTVDVVVGDGAPYRMREGEGGWWQAADRDLAEGERYAFSIDGGPPRPDPRSRWQPEGVHAPSAVVDLSAHEWADAAWAGQQLEGAVIYELHVGTFTPEGTFAAAIEHLDHLLDLGITTVELMPVAAFAGRHGWGYDGVCLFAVHDPYGGPRGLQRFVDACHQRGLAVVLDVVHNHLGPSGNYLAEFAPYFTERHRTPWGMAVNLDGPGSDEVRRYLLDNVRQWLEDYHLDGLRLDAVHALHDERATHLLEEMTTLADEISGRTGLPRSLIAESDRNDPATVAPRGPGGSGGQGLHGQWADDIHHALHAAVTGEDAGYYADFHTPGALATVLGRSPFFHDGGFSSFRGRGHGRPVDPEVTPPWRFVGSLQTHDQVGNRATGDRIAHQAGHGRAAVGAALLLTSPYTPMLFMGEEWAASTPWQFFTDHTEPELAAAIRVGRSEEFARHGWSGEVPDPQDEGTKAASVLAWAERDEPEHAAMLTFYRELLRLRRDHPEVWRAPLDTGAVHHDEATGRILVHRGPVTVLANLGEQPWPLRPGTDDAGTSLDGVDLGSPSRRAVGFGGAVLRDGQGELPPDSVLLLVPQDPR